MNDLQRAKKKMLNNVIAFSDGNTTITATVPAYGTILTQFKVKVVEITSVEQLANLDVKKLAEDKKELKQQVVDTTERIAGALLVYDNVENIGMPGFMYLRSELSALSDADLPGRAREIHSLATLHITNLANFNILPAHLTAFLDIITQYEEKITSVATTEAQVQAANIQLPILFRGAIDILKNLDKLVLGFKTSNFGFYLEYKINRQIDNPKTMHTRIAGIITAVETGNAIAGATIRVTVDNKTFTTLSAADGSYSLRITEYGTHTVFFSKEGYSEMQVSEVVVSKGEKTALDFEMTPVQG